ncbi:MAG: dTDP-4-dehydrorhamnose 3,5-epimerase [Acidobacteriales bacterium]|nr:dTDP-4-dehydrorhamnose 3,5-epimerase [Terriglobales bacterium]
MQLIDNHIPGCYEINTTVLADDRGSFTKTFHHENFKGAGLETMFAEEYFTVSRVGVLRGFHFQTPPAHHTKIVYCVSGTVLDVVLDLRIGSPAYGKCFSTELSPAKGNLIYIPPGVAHAFYVLEGLATLMYKVSTAFSPAHDTGVFWNSVGFDWPTSEPVLSERDRNLPAFGSFLSPFEYSADSE